MSRCSRFISLILFPPFHYCHSTFHKIDTISTRHRLNHSHYFNIIPCTKSIVNASIAPKSFLLACLLSSTISIFSEIIAGAIDCFHIGGTLSIPFLLCPALCIRKYITILSFSSITFLTSTSSSFLSNLLISSKSSLTGKTILPEVTFSAPFSLCQELSRFCRLTH